MLQFCQQMFNLLVARVNKLSVNISSRWGTRVPEGSCGTLRLSSFRKYWSRSWAFFFNWPQNFRPVSSYVCICACTHAYTHSHNSIITEFQNLPKIHPHGDHDDTSVCCTWFINLHNLSFTPNFVIFRQKPSHTSLPVFVIPPHCDIVTPPGLMLSLLLCMVVGPHVGELETFSESEAGVHQPCAWADASLLKIMAMLTCPLLSVRHPT